MVSLQVQEWTLCPVTEETALSRKHSGNSLSTAAEDSFEVISDDSSHPHAADAVDDFQVDLELEEQAIRLYNLWRSELPSYDLLNIGKGNKSLSFLQRLSVFADFRDLYSCQDKEEILVVTGSLGLTQEVTFAC